MHITGVTEEAIAHWTTVANILIRKKVVMSVMKIQMGSILILFTRGEIQVTREVRSGVRWGLDQGYEGG